MLQEGSAFKGLQTVVYRKQAVDDASDVCYAYNVYNTDNEIRVTLSFLIRCLENLLPLYGKNGVRVVWLSLIHILISRERLSACLHVDP